MNFFDKLLSAIECNQSLLYVELDPDPEKLPTAMISGQDMASDLREANLENHQYCSPDWLTGLQTVIAKTADQVCAYKLTLGFYQALGVEGLALLQQVLHCIPAEIPVILDAKYADLNTSTVFARQAFTHWRVDACTVSPYTGQDLAAPFLVYPGKAVFVLCVTANPSAALLQEYPTPDHPLYLQLVQEVQAWGTPEQVGLEVGVMPDMLARIRQAAPERLILIQGDVAETNEINQADELQQILAAGLNGNGEGLLLPVPSRLLIGENVGAAIQELRDTINEERLRVVQGSPTCELWLPDVCLLQHQPHRDLILQLYDIGCITFGDHVQASGAVFPYYIDLRRIISIPQIFHKIVSAYAEILKDLKFDRIAGIPYGSLPTATGLALRMQRPMVFPRKEVKAYGAGRLIEGHFQSGEMIVVVDDILITGNSAIKGAEKLKSVGLQVEDIVVFIDHEQGVKKRLKDQGYSGYSVLTISEIAQTLYQANRVTQEEYELLTWQH